jgi:hypothetical protein
MIRPRHVPAALLFLGLLLASMISQARSITLSPAVVPLRGAFGQSVTRSMTLRNDAEVVLEFELEARDVVVRDGTRVEIEAGELPDSIAASAVFSRARVAVPPHASATVELTLTLPVSTRHRAVVVYFRGTRPVHAGRQQALLSLGTLFTFEVSDTSSIRADALELQPPSDSADLSLLTRVRNEGSEPAIPGGVAAILDAGGRLVGKVALPSRRLLPGESATFRAEYPGELRPGRYQVVVTLAGGDDPVQLEAALVVE